MKEQEPHIYSITAEMVQRLFKENADQAVIISGESGSGKT
jgi:myosin heavy subunit